MKRIVRFILGYLNWPILLVKVSSDNTLPFCLGVCEGAIISIIAARIITDFPPPLAGIIVTVFALVRGIQGDIVDC